MATTAPATKKSNKGRKSAAIALAIVGVAGLSLASAAQLTINNSSLGAGTSVVSACQSASITVAFAPTFGTAGYNATKVTLGGLTTTCNNYNYKVQAMDAAGAPLGTEAFGTTGTGATLDVTLGTANAALVEGISVVIYK